MSQITAIELEKPEPQHPILPVYEGPSALLEALMDLRGEIVNSANQADNSRGMGKAVFQKIIDTGLLRALHPKDLCGAEYSAPDMLPIIEEIA